MAEVDTALAPWSVVVLLISLPPADVLLVGLLLLNELVTGIIFADGLLLGLLLAVLLLAEVLFVGPFIVKKTAREAVGGRNTA